MKVEYVRIASLSTGWSFVWVWRAGGVESMSHYTRRRDAERGFARFINQTRNVIIWNGRAMA
jgi:hypothetical protein